MTRFSETKALTFDLFGTVLDLGGSLVPFIDDSLKAHASTLSAEAFWTAWRQRQRIEQYQDTIVMLGHSGYLETVRRALHYTLRQNGIEATAETVETFMRGWQYLSPFPEVVSALAGLQTRYQLIVLSNGDPAFLEYLVRERVAWDFEGVFSVTSVGAFKPHPSIYRAAASEFGLKVNECMMVSANSFDIMGARACGFRGAFVNRYQLPYEDTPYQPDVTVNDFTELAEALL